ncbi:MAG: type III pantothenate kinase [Colwellia sp.]|nr:type III pantothenate kinase [Colwellia sp.]
MIVLIDIGNTRTKYCLVNEGKNSSQQALLNDHVNNEFLSDKFSHATKFLVASVSHNKLTDEIFAWCQLNKITYQRVVSEIKKNNVVTGYQEPSQLGVDRWLALVGAAALFPNKNILIIDAGTATTIDLLAADGQHQGGWILAGITTLINSVLADTVQVKVKTEERASLAFGTNTSENVHNAAWVATVAAVDSAISQAQQQGIIVDEVVFTGGNSGLLSSLVSHQNTIIEQLVFNGLQAYI